MSERAKRRKLERDVKYKKKINIPVQEILFNLKYSYEDEHKQFKILDSLDDKQFFSINGNPLPKSYAQLGESGHTYTHNDFIKEIKWYTYNLKKNFNKINAFLKLEDDVYSNILLGNYDTAKGIIENIDKSICVSHWSIEQSLIIAEYQNGFKKNKETLANIISHDNQDLTNIFAKYQSVRVEKNLSFFTYENWESFRLTNDSTEYFRGNFTKENVKISVIAASAPQMGMVAASVLTNKLINNFRPKFVVMTGIAGGVKGVGNFGDILISDISFDSGSGKIKTSDTGEAEFLPDFKSINLHADLKENLLSCMGSREFLNEIKSKWIAKKIDTELNIHIGPLASGASVVENRESLNTIKFHSRKLIGIDMETYGVFYTCENCSKPKPIAAMSIKSVSDYGDKEKNDDFQTYAAYTSANFLYQFALNRMDFEI